MTARRLEKGVGANEGRGRGWASVERLVEINFHSELSRIFQILKKPHLGYGNRFLAIIPRSESRQGNELGNMSGRAQ